MLSAPPAALARGNLQLLAQGTLLHRLHDRTYAATSFNPGTGPSRSRFAPIKSATGLAIPTLYAAQTFECAAHETVFYDIVHDRPLKTVPLTRLAPVVHSIIAATVDLTMVQLFEPDLNAWGMTRGDLIDTLPQDYAATARWAEAIHTAHPDAHGMVWTSRRCDPGTAYLLFGDRLANGSLTRLSSVALTSSDAELRAVIGFGSRAGISITL